LIAGTLSLRAKRSNLAPPLGNDTAGHAMASSLRPVQMTAQPGERPVCLQNDRDRRGRKSARRQREMEFSLVIGVSDAGPVPPQRRIAVDRL
jgi:hypothetical protein